MSLTLRTRDGYSSPEADSNSKSESLSCGFDCALDRATGPQTVGCLTFRPPAPCPCCRPQQTEAALDFSFALGDWSDQFWAHAKFVAGVRPTPTGSNLAPVRHSSRICSVMLCHRIRVSARRRFPRPRRHILHRAHFLTSRSSGRAILPESNPMVVQSWWCMTLAVPCSVDEGKSRRLLTDRVAGLGSGADSLMPPMIACSGGDSCTFSGWM